MAEVSKLKKLACQTIDKHADELNEINRKIWGNPELLFEEKLAHQILTDYLDKQNFEVSRHCTMETAFRASSGGEQGPCIGVISEYDALPEVGHACGHNLIAESGVAAGLGIKAALEATNNKLGKVVVLGTPAEEGGGGKVIMNEKGCFKDIDFCMMVHPTPVDSTMPSVLANNTLKATFKGQSSHAAAFPWEGVNALDAAVAAYSSISMLRQQMKPTWRVHGVFTEGGVKPNIIPDRACLKYYYRATSDEEMDHLKQKLISCFEGAATSTGQWLL
ncbi:peptidase M20 domain-containing protein 2 [Exaiptasia diaphana]|uniref:Peptidase M20 dimerisation domain-containing protein n=1 Tax=Exaiptasia diaphana TaxID=2652724 RepID=A0A913XM11_EXADI|nr:peptidase M20 domain-containing protein 2 [Exaiptasia diaphana]